MLSINLQQIIDEINARRNRIRYPFQELAIMLSEKLGDPRHKPLYMKLAKNEEQELLMDALHYVLASPEASGNLGALFMWKLKELKNRPIMPVPILLEDGGKFVKIGTISGVVRGDMPLLIAALTEFSEKFANVEDKTVSKAELIKLPTHINAFLKQFNRTSTIQLFNSFNALNLKGVLKLGRPVLTKRVYKGRMPTV